ncbi:hypothetical protein M9458_055153 [Cirrhinus mrigala]|uniref:Uncharacterized protein n=1 Tax=Cirrhinus mrigala TaxID=683832 RepID=A0ABD0MM74_CIRMR
MEKLLRSMHTLFNNAPVRREDYVAVTKSSVFPLAFCGHRWLENLPVVERALEIWPSLQLYVDAVKRKELPNPGTGSYDTTEATQKDPLILAKLHFFATIARTFEPFLKRYQTDEPVMPFLPKDLADLMKDTKISDLKVLEFRRDCMQVLTNIVRKMQEKSPLKYSTVRQMACLDPSNMFRDPDRCKEQMSGADLSTG